MTAHCRYTGGSDAHNALAASKRTIADIATDNFTGCDIQGKPHPLLVPFIIHEGPQLIHLHRQLSLGFRLYLHLLRHSSVASVDISLQPVLRHFHHTGDSGQGKFLSSASDQSSLYGLGQSASTGDSQRIDDHNHDICSFVFPGGSCRSS
jgi:hypothetical protein